MQKAALRLSCMLDSGHFGASGIATIMMQPSDNSGTVYAPADVMGLQDEVKIFEKQRIESTLADGRTASQAAELLGLSLRTLRRKMRHYGLSSAHDAGAEDADANPDAAGG
jgi:DNA-binding NtrC family response regulator